MSDQNRPHKQPVFSHCVIIDTWPATHLAALLKANFLLSLLQVRQRDRMCALPKRYHLLRTLRAGQHQAGLATCRAGGYLLRAGSPRRTTYVFSSAVACPEHFTAYSDLSAPPHAALKVPSNPIANIPCFGCRESLITARVFSLPRRCRNGRFRGW